MTVELDLATTGLTSETPEHLLIDAGAVYVIEDEDNGGDFEDPDTWELLGATQGGNEFSVEQEFRQIEVDGVKGPFKKGRVLENVEASITANFVEFKKDVLERALPGIDVDDWVDGDGETHDHFTREGVGKLELAEYLDYVILVGQINGSDEAAAVYVQNAMNDGNLEISTEDEDEAVIPITFTGHYDLDNTDKEPWGMLIPKGD